jgi:hypothetical protein
VCTADETSPGGRLDTIPGGGLHAGPVSGLSTVPVARQNTAQTTDIKRARDIGRATGSKRQPNDDRSDRDREAGTAPRCWSTSGRRYRLGWEQVKHRIRFVAIYGYLSKEAIRSMQTITWGDFSIYQQKNRSDH